MDQIINFDLIVIGGGAAGLVAAKIGAAFGLSTCIVEKNKLGGTCTWTGCIPSKTLLNSAHTLHSLKIFKDIGLFIKNDLQINTDHVNEHVSEMVNAVAQNHKAKDLEKMGIKVLFGKPCFVNSNTIQLKNKFYKAKKFIICTGSKPKIPPIDGIADINYLTSQNIFSLKTLPRSLITIGGGPVGCELTQAMQRLGVKTTIIEGNDHLLAQEDPEVINFLEDNLTKDGIKIKTSCNVVKVFSRDSQVKVVIKNSSDKQMVLTADNLLVAAGVMSDIDDLNLAKAKVKFDTEKRIKTNQYLQTTNKNIFACGDVIGPYCFSHVAAQQAIVAARNAIFKKIVWKKIDYANIAWAIFTQPEIAHLGITEKIARGHNKKFKIYKTYYSEVDRYYTDLCSEGMLKIITDTRGRILGAHIVGKNAGELMQSLLIAKFRKIPLYKLTDAMFIYPTFSELIYKTARKSLIEKKNKKWVRWLLNILRNKL